VENGPDGAPFGDNLLALRQALLAWYDRAARDLPWRAAPGAPPPDPYRVLVSEVMLQQTTVAAVIPYFARFLDRFPTVESLAAASQEEVLTLWAGLGYYSRGRNLHAAAQAVAAHAWPRDEAGLRALPGVGAYTAAAVAAIAFGQPATVVDGNIERVMARLFAVSDPVPRARPALRALADRFTAQDRPGDFAQALMELGATICTPKSPKCLLCPWVEACLGRRQGIAETLPRKAPKAEKAQRYGVAFVLVRQNRLFLVRRPQKGLLAGMRGLPTTEWRAVPWPTEEAQAFAPIPAPYRDAGEVRHVFTHFPLALQVLAAKAPKDFSAEGEWLALPGALGLPTVFTKALERGLAALQP
jgi:A/G-specific adenine glycosylase